MGSASARARRVTAPGSSLVEGLAGQGEGALVLPGGRQRVGPGREDRPAQAGRDGVAGQGRFEIGRREVVLAERGVGAAAGDQGIGGGLATVGSLGDAQGLVGHGDRRLRIAGAQGDLRFGVGQMGDEPELAARLGVLSSMVCELGGALEVAIGEVRQGELVLDVPSLEVSLRSPQQGQGLLPVADRGLVVTGISLVAASVDRKDPRRRSSRSVVSPRASSR